MFGLYARCIARASPAARCTFKSSFRYMTNTSQGARTLPKSPPSIAKPQLATERGHPQRVNMLATAMFAAGRTQIYKNSASNGFIATALGIMTMSYCGLGYIYSTRLWDLQVAKDRGLRWFVPVAFQLTMIAWGLFAAYALTRTFSIVKSINLVKQGDQILLQTFVRRGIPFRAPEILLNEPHTLVVNKAKLYGSAYEGMIVAPEGESLVTRLTRSLFYTPFHNTRKALGGVGLVPIQVGPVGSQRHLIIDADGQFSQGGEDFMNLAKDEM